MEINIFNDPSQVPQPRELVKIEQIVATPYPDRVRVRIEVRVTPFLERPNLLLVARNASGQIVNELNVIATMHAHMEFTMHMRGMADPAGDYELEVQLFYETRNPPQDIQRIAFSIPQASN
ncbi:MAG: hypothetical protein RML73_08875 [Anaerolineae bacterium]|nr:hypothetical protein [Anaerolineae bacterium]